MIYYDSQILQILYRPPALLKWSLIYIGRNSNTYIAVTLKEIWRVACADFIPFQANYSFTDIWFGVIWAFHNYNISSEREKTNKNKQKNSSYKLFGWVHEHPCIYSKNIHTH